MNRSRTESRQQQKIRRKRRLRRLIIFNGFMLGLIAVVIGLWLNTQNWFDAGSLFNRENKPQAADAASAGMSDGQKPQNAETDTGSSSPSPSDEAAATKEPAPTADEANGAGEPAATPEKQPEEVGNEAVDGTGGNDVSGEQPSFQAGDEDTVKLSFVGDILLAASVGDMMKLNGYDYPYKQSLLYLSEPDIMAANLEYPVTDSGVPALDKTYVFKGSPEALPAFRDAGFDIVSLANNHTLDQGVEGLFNTMKHLDETGISHMGAGKNDTDAFAPVIKDVRGIKVAYIGLSRVVPEVSWKADKNVAGVAETYDTTRAKAAIKKAKEQADLVVVMVHWGEERKDTPLQYQRDFAREYIDSGADLIIGSHPHVLQGFETYKGKWIAYSLGNFIFSAYPKGPTAETGVLDAICTKKGNCDLKFYPMSSDKAQPVLMEPENAAALLKRLTSLSFGVKLREDGALVSK
ncbi:CapA family protein [Paenibacillus sp. FSL H8-0537]|uniref:CapA family protein n=1 Tax=Paenibacillus sp. FSL H8-0537 TaxID=2921399 RepID=UPI003100F026